METITTNLRLDFNDTSYKFVKVHQNDNNTRLVNITVLKDNQPYPLSSSTHTIHFYLKRPLSGQTMRTVSVDNRTGTVSFYLTKEDLYHAGIGKAELKIYENSSDAVIATMPFDIVIVEDVINEADAIASDDYSALDDLLTRLEASIGKTFVPRGVIEFADLEYEPKTPWYTYTIKDAFVTDDSFKCGAGKSCDPGTTVYCLDDGKWEIVPSSLITGVKGSNEEKFRTGNIELSSEDIGAIDSSTNSTATAVVNFKNGLKFGAATVSYNADKDELTFM